MASANVVNFTTDGWENDVVKSDKPVIVDFWAVWCGPCRMLTPTIDRLADQFAGKVKIGKLNIDEHPDIAARFGVASIPQVLFFKGGPDPLQRVVGVHAENEYVKLINRMLEPQGQ
jgi:thioredoxin 1